MIEENEQRRLADYLSEVAAGTVDSWMRIIEVEEDVLSPGSGQVELQAQWQGDGTFALGTSRYSDDYGHFRLIVKVEPISAPPSDPEWCASSFLHIQTGDRLRMGTEEAVVVRCAVQQFHVDNTDKYRPRPWKHWEVRAELLVGGVRLLPFQQYPTDTPVEILCDAERAAQLTLSEAQFVGTEQT